MIKVNIIKNGVVTNSAMFETRALADAWLAKEQDNNSFGKNERWVRDSLFSPLTQEEKDSALDQREIEILEETAQEYLLSAEYEVEIVNLGDGPKLEALRVERNIRLADSDWTQLADCPLSDEQKAAWIIYRQELRDLLQLQDLNVNNPQWPNKPSE